jgi:SOS-response transcriptional repressor LexA
VFVRASILQYMTERLTHPRSTILKYIDQYRRVKGTAPSTRDIAMALNFGSTSTVHYQLKVLEELEMITMQPGKQRTAALTDKGRREIAP